MHEKDNNHKAPVPKKGVESITAGAELDKKFPMKVIHFGGTYLSVCVGFEPEQLRKIVALLKKPNHPDNPFWTHLRNCFSQYPPALSQPDYRTQHTLFIDYRPLDWERLGVTAAKNINDEAQHFMDANIRDFQGKGPLHRLRHGRQMKIDLEKRTKHSSILAEDARRKISSLKGEFPNYHMIRYAYVENCELASEISFEYRGGPTSAVILGTQSETERFMDTLIQQNAPKLLFSLFTPADCVLVPYLFLRVHQYVEDPSSPHGKRMQERNLLAVNLKTMQELGAKPVNNLLDIKQVVVSDYRVEKI